MNGSDVVRHAVREMREGTGENVLYFCIVLAFLSLLVWAF